MNWKNIILSGAATGAILAVLILIVFILPELDPGSMAVLCGGWFSLSVLSAYSVNQLSKYAEARSEFQNPHSYCVFDIHYAFVWAYLWNAKP